MSKNSDPTLLCRMRWSSNVYDATGGFDQPGKLNAIPYEHVKSGDLVVVEAAVTRYYRSGDKERTNNGQLL